MTRRRKRLLVVLAIVLLAAGGFAWYWQATAADRQFNALLDEVREEEAGLVEGLRAKLGLGKDRPTGREWLEVADDLAKLGPSAVPELIRALRDSDREVRAFAAWALGELGDARGVEPLIAALNDESKVVRSFAAGALGELGDVRAVEPLKELLGDESADARSAAAKALKQLRGQSEGKP